MKQAIIIIFSVVLASCTTDSSLENFLAKQKEYELQRNERKSNAITNLISESPNKELQVQSKLQTLDSLYDRAICKGLWYKILL